MPAPDTEGTPTARPPGSDELCSWRRFLLLGSGCGREADQFPLIKIYNAEICSQLGVSPTDRLLLGYRSGQFALIAETLLRAL